MFGIYVAHSIQKTLHCKLFTRNSRNGGNHLREIYVFFKRIRFAYCQKSTANMIWHSLLLDNLHIFPKTSTFKVEIFPK